MRSVTTSILTALTVIVITTNPQAATIQVPSEQPTIQAGVDAAVSGDTVLVAAGTYSGVGNEEVAIIGKAIVLKSESGPSTTILQTESAGRTIVIDSVDTDAIVIEGFTVSGGYENGLQDSVQNEYRGGISVANSSISIRNCSIRGCYANTEAGLDVLYGGVTRVEDCAISNNITKSGSGGGVFIRCDTVVCLTSTISHNWSMTGFGGGLMLMADKASVNGCTVSENRVRQGSDHVPNPGGGGGGLAFSGNRLAIDSCTFAHNSAFDGGAMFASYGNLIITNSTFYNNMAYVFAVLNSGLKSDYSDSGSALIEHNTFVCNYASTHTGAATYSTYEPWSTDGVRLQATSDTQEDVISSPATGDLVCRNNILAFNSCQSLLRGSLDNWQISNNNFWHMVCDEGYDDDFSAKIGSDGNIAADPLFCNVSADDCAIDISSPCAGTADDGGNMGAFGVGCDMYIAEGPVTIEVLGTESFDDDHTTDSVLAAFERAKPWDTLHFSYPFYEVIDSIKIDIPLYIYGSGMYETHVRGGASPTAFFDIGAFCVLAEMRIDKWDMSGWPTYAVQCSNASPMILKCNILVYPMSGSSTAGSVGLKGASPILRDCVLAPLANSCVICSDYSLPVMAAHNYWASIFCGIPCQSDNVYCWPCLDSLPTNVEYEYDPTIPETHTLHQNYPNPFNPSTTIEFELPNRSHATLIVYNVLGQAVATLLNRELPAGSHRVTWDSRDADGNELAAGVYLYRLTSDDFVESRKMVLLK